MAMTMTTFGYILCMVLTQTTPCDTSAHQSIDIPRSRMQDQGGVLSGLAGESRVSSGHNQKNSGVILQIGESLVTSTEESDKAEDPPPSETSSVSESKPATEEPTDASASAPPSDQSSQEPSGETEEKPASRPVEPPSKQDGPLLSPGDPEENNHEKKEDASAKISAAQELLRTVNADNLSKQQHETLAAIESFLEKSHEALSMKDYPRALNLAKKAHTLASELVKAMEKEEKPK